MFPYETDTCFCVCNAETKACTGPKSRGNLGMECSSREQKRRGLKVVCLCVVSLFSLSRYFFLFYVSGEGLAPIVSAYSRLILVDGTVL